MYITEIAFLLLLMKPKKHAERIRSFVDGGHLTVTSHFAVCFFSRTEEENDITIKLYSYCNLFFIFLFALFFLAFPLLRHFSVGL